MKLPVSSPMSEAMSENSRNRLDEKLALKRPLLTCYFPVGDPLVPLEYLSIYAECGVDIVELGLPSPNPFMDGEVVSQSMRRSLGDSDIFARAEAAARYLRGLPAGPAAICMTYGDINLEGFLGCSAFADIDGLLMLGLAGESNVKAVARLVAANNMRVINFVGWGLAADSVHAARLSDGYIMLQAVDGTTGARASLDPRNENHIHQLRDFGVSQAILLGFGISTPLQAAEAVALGADGVIIGSVTLQKALDGPAALRAYLKSVREALGG